MNDLTTDAHQKVFGTTLEIEKGLGRFLTVEHVDQNRVRMTF